MVLLLKLSLVSSTFLIQSHITSIGPNFCLAISELRIESVTLEFACQTASFAKAVHYTNNDDVDGEERPEVQE